MEYKEALDILKKMLEKNNLTEKEKEALVTAIGALDWFKMGKNRVDRIIKSQKMKRAKNFRKQFQKTSLRRPFL